jgi:hypothetical protein
MHVSHTFAIHEPYAAHTRFSQQFQPFAASGQITGNQSSRSLSPARIPCPGEGGEVGPGRSTNLASSPTNRSENARRRPVKVFPPSPVSLGGDHP